MFRIKPGSIYHYLGLQERDVLKSFNGERLDDAGRWAGMAQSLLLLTERRFALEVERGGSRIEIVYEVE